MIEAAWNPACFNTIAWILDTSRLSITYMIKQVIGTNARTPFSYDVSEMNVPKFCTHK